MTRPVGEASGGAPEKAGLHPRSRHRDRYDFGALVKACSELGPFVLRGPHGLTVDFADPRAVRLLNRAILHATYGIAGWDIPEGYLCPPIPGRADYVHHAADLLAALSGGAIPRGSSIRVLDIGTGANLVYPLIGHREYGWSFVGTDIDKAALGAGRKILRANTGLDAAIELRLQRDRGAIFEGVLKTGEVFDLAMCNPPFFASALEARASARDKWRKLGRSAQGARRNFGGHEAELWCEGGEAAFVRRMIEESARHPEACRWFTSLVSKSSNLPALRQALDRAGVREVRTVDMAHGQKRARFLAWRFEWTGLEEMISR
ncbi:MAG TPA: 23S rRNA (adenine(1618)-N(6))-methyltransferase RlmF [Holophagaceae bacterium]|jgi:23S rRNA (adenine1618-N6)-methyltransferase|nr:23S rRNA (adenine(1618)-N(6))-methyltransferase RlmF [Holophagaceae bacterium]